VGRRQLRYLRDGSAKGAKSLQALVMERLSSSCVKLNIVHAETKDIRLKNEEVFITAGIEESSAKEK